MEPGDAVCLNDPYAGGTHLPDITFVTPVFLTGGARPDFYCANRAHHADVGGAVPGSMAPARDVHGEGLRIPPVRLFRGGELDREVLDLLLANMRVPSEREADLVAQASANRIGARRLAGLAAEHGTVELSRRARQLLDWTAALSLECVPWTAGGELGSRRRAGGRFRRPPPEAPSRTPRRCAHLRLRRDRRVSHEPAQHHPGRDRLGRVLRAPHAAPRLHADQRGHPGSARDQDVARDAPRRAAIRRAWPPATSRRARGSAT